MAAMKNHGKYLLLWLCLPGMNAKEFIIYPIIFVLGMSSFWLIDILMDSPRSFFVTVSISTGLAAVIAAWIIRKPYRQALTNDKCRILYGWLLAGVLLAYLLLGFLLYWSSLFTGGHFHPAEFILIPLIVSYTSLPFSFIQNMLLGIVLTEVLRRKQQRTGMPPCV